MVHRLGHFQAYSIREFSLVTRGWVSLWRKRSKLRTTGDGSKITTNQKVENHMEEGVKHNTMTSHDVSVYLYL